MFVVIGEILENEEDGEVMGVVVNVCKVFFRIGVWICIIGRYVLGCGDGDVVGGKGCFFEKGKEILMMIGKWFKEVFRLFVIEQFEFFGYIDSVYSGSICVKVKFVV